MIRLVVMPAGGSCRPYALRFAPGHWKPETRSMPAGIPSGTGHRKHASPAVDGGATSKVTKWQLHSP